MGFLHRMDKLFLDKTEALCHRIQVQTGKTNFWIAGKLYLFFTGLIVLIVVWSMFPPTPTLVQKLAAEIKSSPIISSLLFAAMWRRTVYGWQKKEAEAFARLLKGLSNPEKISKIEFCSRVVFEVTWIFITAVDILAAVTRNLTLDGMILFVLVTLYGWTVFILEALDPLPPCSGKIQERLKAFFLKPATHETAARCEVNDVRA